MIGAGHLGRGPGDAEPPPRPDRSSRRSRPSRSPAGRMVELRKKTEGASKPDVDRREYIVGVELLTAKPTTPAEPRQPRPKAKPSRSRRPPSSPSEKGQDQGRQPRSRRAARGGHLVSLFRRHHRLRDRRSGDGPGRRPRGGPAPPHAALRRGIRGGQGAGPGAERRGQGALPEVRRASSASIPSSASTRSRTIPGSTGSST